MKHSRVSLWLVSLGRSLGRSLGPPPPPPRRYFSRCWLATRGRPARPGPEDGRAATGRAARQRAA